MWINLPTKASEKTGSIWARYLQTDVVIQTYSLEEYADVLLGSHEPAQIAWLTRRLRGEAQPVLPGYKAGRRWRATEEHIREAIRLLEPQRNPAPELSRFSSMTRTSRRRLSS
ncbi:MAG: hypothetical protein HYZ38_05035 [Mycobacterium sp.]|nr:hypothetical protein [Mycobacterium sp.]